MTPPVKDAATVILVRRTGDDARVLMGQRGQSAAFMPGKFVFPGGAVDEADYARLPPGGLNPLCARRLVKDCDPALAPALLNAALRELREETGLTLGSVSSLHFVFRAITPPNRPRRFDARFFQADAKDIPVDLDDFSQADAELSHLQWVTVREARALDLPFVTKVVLGELEAGLTRQGPPDVVPFFDHRGYIGQVTAIR